MLDSARDSMGYVIFIPHNNVKKGQSITFIPELVRIPKSSRITAKNANILKVI